MATCRAFGGRSEEAPAVGGRARALAQRAPRPRRHRGQQRVPARQADASPAARHPARGQRRGRDERHERARLQGRTCRCSGPESLRASSTSSTTCRSRPSKGRRWSSDGSRQRLRHHRRRLPPHGAQEDVLVQLHPPVPHRRADAPGRPSDSTASIDSVTTWGRRFRFRTTSSTSSGTAGSTARRSAAISRRASGR